MMRHLVLIILLLFGVSFARSQNDTTSLLSAVKRLELALVSKDSVQIEQLLHQGLSFGHSNGWVQSRKDVLDDMRTGYLVYNKILNESRRMFIRGKFGHVQERIKVEGFVNEKAFNLNLFVQQLWMKTRKGWKLLMRQSARQQ